MTKMKPEEQQEMIRDAILGYYQDPVNEELLGAFDAILEDAGRAEGPWRIQETSYGNGFLLIREKKDTPDKWVFEVQVNGEYHTRQQEHLAGWLAKYLNARIERQKEDPPPNVRGIVEEYLQSHGYDGLCTPDTDCGCGLDDFTPCGIEIGDCIPAYKHVNRCSECYAQGCEGRDITEEEVACYHPDKPPEKR